MFSRSLLNLEDFHVSKTLKLQFDYYKASTLEASSKNAKRLITENVTISTITHFLKIHLCAVSPSLSCYYRNNVLELTH